MWEFEFQGKNVESLSGLISNLELVGVVIKIENLKNLSNDIEIRVQLFGGLLEGGDLGVSDNVG